MIICSFLRGTRPDALLRDNAGDKYYSEYTPDLVYTRI